MKRVILSIAAILLISFMVFTYKLIVGKPFNFNHAVERITIQALFRDPETLTFLGFLDNTIVDFHSHRLTDASPAYEKETREIARKNLELIRSYDRDRLSYQKQLTYDIFSGYLETIVESEKYPYHMNSVNYPGPYPVNQLFGVQSEVPAFLKSSHQIVDKISAENYIKRLKAIPAKFDQVLETLRYREDMGVIPPRFTVTKVITQMEKFIMILPEENVLYVSFSEKISKRDEIEEKDREKLKQEVVSTIETDVYPAYGKLIAFLEKQKARAVTNHGIWKIPGGDDYYRYLLRFHTTTDMTPEEIHDIGHSEVLRITSEMKAILNSQGYRGGTVSELMKRISREDRFHYPDTDEGREQILADYTAILEEIDKGLDDHFNLRPKQGVKVQRVPEFKEKTAPGAYYNPPSLDGSRPGIFYINLRSVEELQKFGMRTLAFHEAIPGHHFQLALAQEIEGVPTFRKVYPFTAYAEGWALYSEQLAREMGFHEDPFSNLGRLQAELFRAVRLVVDTGLHYKRWTREKAIDYMLEKTGMPKTDVIAEIERYMVMPGQACAYMVGMLKILQLREKSWKELSSAFSIKDFHDVVLKNGSVPLDILERIIGDYISEKR